MTNENLLRLKIDLIIVSISIIVIRNREDVKDCDVAILDCEDPELLRLAREHSQIVLFLGKKIGKADVFNKISTVISDWEIFRTIVEQSPDPIVIFDSKGVLYANPKAYEYAGAEASKIKRILDLVLPEFRELALERMKKIIGGEKVEPIELPAVMPDGRIFWFESKLSLINFGGRPAFLMILRDVTQKRRAEENLEKTSKRYREFFDNSLDIIVVTDIKGNFLEVNRAFEETFGLKSEEVKGKHFAEVLGIEKEVAEEIFRSYNRAFREKRDLKGLVFEVKRRDGGRIVVEGNVRLLWEGGKVVGFVGNFRDITDRIRLQEKLRESEEKYRSIFNFAPVAIIVWDEEIRVVDWNKKAEEIFGWKKEEVLGKSFLEFLIPRSEMGQLNVLIEEITEGKIFTHSIIHNRTKDGKTIACEWFNITYMNNSGKKYLISIAQDVTQRIEIEKKLKESEERYRKIFEHSPTLIALLDENGTIIEANPAMIDSIGVDPVGKTIFDLFSKEVAERRFYEMKRACEEGKPITIQDERDGKCYINHYVPLRLEGKNQCLIIAQDITELVKLNKFLMQIVQVAETLAKVKDRKELVERIEEILSDYGVEISEIPKGVYFDISHEGKHYGYLCARNIGEREVELLRIFAEDLGFVLKSLEDEKRREELYQRLVENIQTIAYLVDGIRNPLAVMLAYAELLINDEVAKERVFQQVDRIVKIMRELDISWIKSEELAGRKVVRTVRSESSLN